MSSISSNFGRVPTFFASQSVLSRINHTNAALLRVQQQISTGRSVNRTSDDPLAASTIGTLDDRLERSEQLRRNLSHADSSLGLLDNALAEAGELISQGHSIASAQSSSISGPDERNAQATIIDQLIQSMLTVSGRQSSSGYLFGGTMTSTPPLVAFGGGYRSMGTGDGLTTDLAPYGQIPITLGRNNNPIGNVSARVRGDKDLNAALTGDTSLDDLGGARGLGITPGIVEFSVSVGGGGGPSTGRVSVDLSSCDTAQDVANALTAAIHQYETDNSTPTPITVLGPGGVSFSGGSFSIDVATGSPAPTIQFFDPSGGVTAQDLGLAADSSATTPITFSSTSPTGLDTSPNLTWRTPVSALAGVTGALGSIKINNLGRSATVDLSGATTLQDVKNAIEGTNLGVRVAINDAGTGIDVLNEVAAGKSAALSIEEVSGSNLTATRLGIRTLSLATPLSAFNDGRGIGILNGTLNPTTGLPDPSLDTDFHITLGDAAQTTLTIDLRPQDTATVQTLIDRINSQAATQLAAAGLPTTAFQAGLSTTTNGITLTQDASFPGAIAVAPDNNSVAAEQLGFLNGTYNATSATFIAQDRATVRVDNVFTHLIDLRDALRANDVRGISLASQNLERSEASITETRGLVGAYGQRVDHANVKEADRATLDESIRSQLRDTDITRAASTFTALQTQLQAGLRVAAMSQNQNLLDFLT